MDKTGSFNKSTISLLAELVLDEAMQKFHRERLYKEIDKSLIEGNKASFYSLTKELQLYFMERDG